MSDEAPRHVLVPGGLGFVGSNLASAFCAQGAHVTVIDALLPSTGASLSNLEGLEVRVVEGDLRTSPHLRTLVAEADVIVNCAAATSHVRSFAAPFDCIDANLSTAVALLEAIRACSAPPRLVQVSTSSQIGRVTRPHSATEQYERPLDLYSVCKLAAEKAVFAYGEAYGLEVTSLRLPNLYGPRARIDDPGLGFACWFLGRALSDDTIPVFAPGTQLRNFLHVDDACAALTAAARHEDVRGRCIQVAHRDHVSVLDFARTLEQVVGGRVALQQWPEGRRAIEVGDVVLDGEPAARLFDLRPPVTLAEGLAETAEWFRGRRGGGHAASTAGAARRGPEGGDEGEGAST